MGYIYDSVLCYGHYSRDTFNLTSAIRMKHFNILTIWNANE